jgi:gamma-glutamyltranspeptidase/glutathione hydrolase
VNQTQQRGIVTSPHHLATRVGTDILQAGGNAFDAAVGVSLAIGVVQPYHSGVGGGANITYHQADGTAGHINARGPAPKELVRDLFFAGQQADNGKPNYALVQSGGLASTIPSLVAGLWALHKRRGKLSWADVCSLPQQLAAQGFRADFMLAGTYQRASVAEKLAQYAQETQFATPITEGTRVQQPQLAETLGVIGKDSRAIYTGELAQQLVSVTQKHGGVLSFEDLRDYQPQHTQLLETDYRGWTVFAPGLPTIGSLQTQVALKLLRHFDLTQYAAGSTEHLHLIAEVVKASYRGRAEIDDDASAAALASDENIKKWQADISLEQAQQVNFGAQDTSHTSHFCVADADGNVVSQTQTIRSYFGSGVVDPVSGVVMNDSVGDFSLQVGEATTQGITYQGTYNLLAPHREPASSQSPLIAVHPDGDIIAAGAAGGPRIVSATLQALVNQIDFDADAQLALTMPRVHSHGAVTDVQTSVLASSLRALEHQTNLTDQHGIAQTIRLRGDTWQGGADPRGPGGVGIVFSDNDADNSQTTCRRYGYSYDD